MQTIRPHRDARRTRVPRHLRLEVAVALLALVAQLVVPHLHRWQVAGHATPAVRDVHERSSAASTTVAHLGAAQHAESSCAICQALAASHDFLVAVAQHAAPAARPDARGALLDARVAQAPSGPNAARSPPRTA